MNALVRLFNRFNQRSSLWFYRSGGFVAIGVTIFLMACWALGIPL